MTLIIKGELPSLIAGGTETEPANMAGSVFCAPVTAEPSVRDYSSVLPVRISQMSPMASW